MIGDSAAIEGFVRTVRIRTPACEVTGGTGDFAGVSVYLQGFGTSASALGAPLSLGG